MKNKNKIKNIEGDLIKLIQKRSKKKIDQNTNLIDNDIVDSLFLMEIISFLEQNYKINLSLNKISIEDFKSIKNITLLISKTIF